MTPSVLQIPSDKTMDVNRYATKKTIAQGMLDVALLTANASQLKYVLQLGYDNHPFYTLMLTAFWLNLDLPFCTGLCQHRRPDGGVCGAPLDLKGRHARGCAVGGWLVR